MRTGLNAKLGNWIIVGALMVLISMASASYAQTQPLTDAEVYWLTYMREEEKLARDVYLTLYEKWGSGIFANIAASELTHMNAIKKLLDKYGIADPAAGNDIGIFTEESGLKTLYDEFIERGTDSLEEALSVGVEIEQKDILDLNNGKAASTHKDITTVYTNLMLGSLNHLAAFNSGLEYR